MNVGWIMERAARYLHRDDFSNEDFDTALEATAIDIGAMLQSPENEVVLVVASGDPNPVVLPARAKRVRYVAVQQTGGPEMLQSKSYGYVLEWMNAGGIPAFYNVKGRELLVSPNGTQQRTITYWEQPAEVSVTGVQTNAVLTAYPMLYLYRVLAECCKITQDLELVAGYESEFARRVETINGELWQQGAAQSASRG